MRDLLSTVCQKPVKTSKGVTGLPILYRDASQVGVLPLGEEASAL